MTPYSPWGKKAAKVPPRTFVSSSGCLTCSSPPLPLLDLASVWALEGERLQCEGGGGQEESAACEELKRQTEGERGGGGRGDPRAAAEAGTSAAAP